MAAIKINPAAEQVMPEPSATPDPLSIVKVEYIYPFGDGIWRSYTIHRPHLMSGIKVTRFYNGTRSVEQVA